MLKQLVTSRVPIIEVTNNDPVYIVELIESILGTKVKIINGNKIPDEPNSVFISDVATVSTSMYKDLERINSTLIFLSKKPLENNYSYFLGEIYPTFEFLEKKFKINKATYYQLAGRTTTQINTTLRFSKANNLDVRQALNYLYPPNEGVFILEKDNKPYSLQGKLLDWMNLNYDILKNDVPVLRPRGIMLTGKEGTGKTSFAKYLGEQLDWTVVKLDISNSLKRYIGESEAQVKNHLQSIAQMTPCVLLIDEVEKLFNGKDETGVINRILGYFLWWLAEHKEQIFTIMTSNDLSSVPKELYREGRLDEVIVLQPLSNIQAYNFALDWLSNNQLSLPKKLNDELKGLCNASEEVTPTQAIEYARKMAKKNRQSSKRHSS